MRAVGPFALALLAGVVSFSSPCCLPLMPGYVSFVSGVAAQPGTIAVRTRVLGSAVLFVSGFAIVFTSLGAAASVLGGLFLADRALLVRVAGAFVLVMGLVMLGILRIPLLSRELRLDMSKVRPAPVGAFPLGMAFAIGWTPCIGPVLAGILATASTSGGATRGALLLLVYSLGLGIPFLLLAWGSTRAGPMFRWLRRHGRAVEIVGGGVLVLMGVLMLLGRWTLLFAPILRWFSRLGWPPI